MLDAVHKLADDATLDEIAEEVALAIALRRSEREIDAGQGIPHDEIKRRLAPWMTTTK